jgi:hypothetical protein
MYNKQKYIASLSSVSRSTSGSVPGTGVYMRLKLTSHNKDRLSVGDITAEERTSGSNNNRPIG